MILNESVNIHDGLAHPQSLAFLRSSYPWKKKTGEGRAGYWLKPEELGYFFLQKNLEGPWTPNGPPKL
jgi:hypothetical protein